jgi:hypothetical protein
MYLRGKFTSKHKSDIKDMLDKKISSQVTVEEASDIIKYMYNQ